MIYGWITFFRQLSLQRRKRHGAGKAPLMQAIYIAACGQYLVDHQWRCPGKLPWHGRMAQRLWWGFVYD